MSRGYRRLDAVAILLSTAVIFPFLYFLWRSLGLRVGETWPMFIWPFGFAAAAINLSMLRREDWRESFVRWSLLGARVAIFSGIAFVVAVFLYYVATPWNLIGRTDPIGREAGYQTVVRRAETVLKEAGATWIATTDYRTYSMLRWFFRGRVPVVQINERGRYLGFSEPDMNLIKGHAGLYVGREPDNDPANPLWASIPATQGAA